MDAGTYPWVVRVRDLLNRERDVRLRTDGGVVRMVTPLGEGLTMTPEECEELSASLQAAADRARSRT